MDYRFLVFGVLVIYVAIQAHAKPYILASDNALEQCILIALMLIIFLDIDTAVPIFAESDKSGSIMARLQVRTVAVLIITVLVFVLVMAHKSANAKAAKLAKIGVVTTSKVFTGPNKADKDDEDVMDDPRVSDDENSSRKAANKAKKERIETENSEIILRHGLTEAEVKQYRAAFAVFDDGDTGTVDAAELSHLFTMMGQAVDNIQGYMKEFDGDGSGKVCDLLRVGIMPGRKRILCTRSVLSAELFRDGGIAGHAKTEAKGRRRGNAVVRHAHQLARVERQVCHYHGRDARTCAPGEPRRDSPHCTDVPLIANCNPRALNLAHIFGQPCAIFALSRTCLSKSSGSSRLRTTRPRR